MNNADCRMVGCHVLLPLILPTFATINSTSFNEGQISNQLYLGKVYHIDNPSAYVQKNDKETQKFK